MPDESEKIGAHESEEQNKILFVRAKIPMLLIDPEDGAIVEANQAACGYYGYTAEQLAGMRISDINVLTQDQVAAEMQRADQEKRTHFYFRHRLASGEVRDVEVYSGPLRINDRHLLYSVIHDITERRKAERRLRESEACFRHIMEHAPLGVAVTDLDGRFIHVNEAMCGIVGWSQEELEGKAISDITFPADLAISQEQMKKLIAGECPVAKYEKRYLHKNGRQLWVQVSISLERDGAGAPQYFIHVAEDIGKRKEAERRISYLAQHDRMTGLPNRDLFLDRLSRSIAHARRKHQKLVLFFLDLDGFKAINDNFGHEAGDTVLKVVARRLLSCIRDVDTAARLGGDEFAVIFEEINQPQDVAPIAKKIIRDLSEPIPTGNQAECRIGVSIGIAVYPENGDEIDRLMSAADDAMYASKSQGKGTYTYFTGKAPGYADNYPWINLDVERLLGNPEIDHQHQELARMLNELNDAVRANDPPEAIARLFDEMMAYTEMHFAVEEQLMDKFGYPDKDAHKAEHKRLLDEASYLKDTLARGGELRVLQSVKDWLLAHTINVDKPFVEYLHHHGAK